MDRLKEFYDFKTGIDNKLKDLQAERSTLTAKLKEASKQLSLAKLKGEKVTDLNKEVTDLKHQIKAIENEMEPYRDTEALEIYKRENLERIANGIFTKIKAEEKKVMDRAEKVHQDTEKAKKEYLQQFAELGKLQKDIDSLESDLFTVKEYVTTGKVTKLQQPAAILSRRGTPYEVTDRERAEASQIGYGTPLKYLLR